MGLHNNAITVPCVIPGTCVMAHVTFLHTWFVVYFTLSSCGKKTKINLDNWARMTYIDTMINFVLLKIAQFLREIILDALNELSVCPASRDGVCPLEKEDKQ
jgi:hypothetical protein